MQSQFGVKIEVHWKKAFCIMGFECRNAHSNPLFCGHEILNFLTKLWWKTVYLSVNLLILISITPIFNHWFTFSLDSLNYENSSSSKCLLKVKTVNTKKYGREAMTNNAISSWNSIQKIISSHLLQDLSYSNLRSLLVKHFLKSYSNNA